MRIVLIIMSVFLLAGAVLTGYMLLNLDSRDIINVDIGRTGASAVDFSALQMKPGDSKEYVLSIGSELPGDCVMTIDFTETDDGKLKDFVYVVVEANGKVLCDKLLRDLFEAEEPIELDCKINKYERFDVKVKYYMPIEVDNSAKNTHSDFMIKITVSNE